MNETLDFFIKKICLNKFDVFSFEAARVFFGEREGFGINIRSDDADGRTFFFYGDGNRTGTCANVPNDWGLGGRFDDAPRSFDQLFRFRAGDQHSSINKKFSAVKNLRTQKIGERFMSETTPHQSGERSRRGSGQSFIPVSDEPAAISVEDVSQ